MNDLKYLLFCILKQNLCPLYLVDADYAWLDSTKGKWANMFFLILLNHHLEHNIMTHVCHLSWTSCNRLTPPNETPAANPVIPSLSKTSGGSDKMFQQFPESYWNLGQHGVLCAAIQTVSSNAKCDRLPLTWKSVTNHPQNIRYLVIVRDFRKRGAGVLFSENPVTAHKHNVRGQMTETHGSDTLSSSAGLPFEGDNEDDCDDDDGLMITTTGSYVGICHFNKTIKLLTALLT